MKKSLDNEKPIFIQIKETIEEDILTGNLSAGDRIPSTNELVSFYNINPVTAQKGVNLLLDEGLIYKKRGIGMFVSDGAGAQLRDRYKSNFTGEYVETMIQKARQLGIDKESLFDIIEKNWNGDDEDA